MFSPLLIPYKYRIIYQQENIIKKIGANQQEHFDLVFNDFREPLSGLWEFGNLCLLSESLRGY